MRVIDHTIHVAIAIKKCQRISMTNLTEEVWGSSGRGNTTLTKTLFPYCVRMKIMECTKVGRAYIYTPGQNLDKFLLRSDNLPYSIEAGLIDTETGLLKSPSPQDISCQERTTTTMVEPQ